jgi:hypothetical protein
MTNCFMWYQNKFIDPYDWPNLYIASYSQILLKFLIDSVKHYVSAI